MIESSRSESPEMDMPTDSGPLNLSKNAWNIGLAEIPEMFRTLAWQRLGAIDVNLEK